MNDSGEVLEPNGVVGGSIPGYGIVYLFDGNLARWLNASYVSKKGKKRKKEKVVYNLEVDKRP